MVLGTCASDDLSTIGQRSKVKGQKRSKSKSGYKTRMKQLMALFLWHTFLTEALLAQLDIWPPEVKGHEVRRSNNNLGVKSVPRPGTNLKVLLTPNLVRVCTVLVICARNITSTIGQRSGVKGHNRSNDMFKVTHKIWSYPKLKMLLVPNLVYSWRVMKTRALQTFTVTGQQSPGQRSDIRQKL